VYVLRGNKFVTCAVGAVYGLLSGKFKEERVILGYEVHGHEAGCESDWSGDFATRERNARAECVAETS
jgi:hypothetical protein